MTNSSNPRLEGTTRRAKIAVSPEFIPFDRADTEQSIAARFEQQAARHARRIAVKSGKFKYSYEALNRAANRIAHAVLARTPDQAPIALLFEHGAPFVAAILGALKAGKIYVPLDASFPLDRNRHILENSGATLMLASSGAMQAATLLAAGRCAVMNIDQLAADLSEQNPNLDITPDQPAYIIYTSGSTGQPKGVVQVHRNVLNVVMRYTNAVGLGPKDRLALLSSVSVTASVGNIFGALLNGASLFPFNVKANTGADLANHLNRYQITVYQSVPSVFRHFASELTGNGLFPDLRVIRLGSAPLYRSDFDLFKAHFSDGCMFINGYGASEMSTVSQYCVDKNTEIDSATIPIGYPLADTRIILLDEQRKPVATGSVGEIALQSRYLSPGYWRDPALSSEVFLDDLSGDGTRLYLTGDIGRAAADGCIEHLGRKDFQVKVRGYRIEVGEIERTMLAHPSLREAVVVAQPDRHGENQLVAYLVASDQPKLASSGLRDYLKEKVPEYMVPAAFVMLDALPLTPNGKIDRLALLATDRTGADEDSFVAPRTPDEEAVAAIWVEVLKLDRVGIYDNFFELGGHSLLATQVVSRVRKSFDVDVSLRDLFEQPAVAAFAEAIARAGAAKKDKLDRLAALRPAQRAFLEQKLNGKSGEARAQGIPRRSGVGPAAPSFGQQRLWFLDQYESNSSLYNSRLALQLSGSLDVQALRAALREIVRRHESLRTTFELVNGEPLQRIHAPGEFELSFDDLRALPAEAREAESTRLRRAASRQPFDLNTGLLIRARLVRLADDGHVLSITLHHIASDAWSIGILRRELGTLYGNYVAGAPPSLPELPIQYVDYAVWQRECLQGETLDKQTVYWKKQLAGLPPLLELPTNRPRPALQTFGGAGIAVTLHKRLITALQAVARSEQATLFMVLLAAFQILLSRYARSDDIAVGSPVAGRTHAETENLIGLFINTLVMRTDLSGNPSIRDLLKRVRETALSAYAHQELPFEKLVEELKPERSLSYAPLVQVLLVLQNVPRPTTELPNLAIEPIRSAIETAKFDLTLYATEREGNLNVLAEYNTDLFDAATIERLLGHLQTLLEGIASDPERRIGDLPLLSPAERNELLIDWNRTEAHFRADSLISSGLLPCAHHLFEAQVQKTPDAIAAVCEGAEIDYRELNRRANQLAHHLIASGVRRDVLVGICVERSLDMIVGLLGIWKAGGAYVPLDPGYPKDRLGFMLEDARLPVLLTQQPLLSELPPHSAKLVCLDSGWDEIAAQPDHNPITGNGEGGDERSSDNGITGSGSSDDESLAYVIYTSGSTGKPKGVCISHRALVNFLHAMRDQTGIGAHDALLAVTTLSFDIAALELHLPLITGALLVLANRATVVDGDALIGQLSGGRITLMQATPATWRLLIDSGWRGSERLRVLCGGEALPDDLAEQLLARCASLTNLYGPTETTVWSTAALVQPDETISIGRPIANTKIYILDAHMNPTPVGVPGELHIGGAGVARGYLNRPELTAEKFIAHPFGDGAFANGERLYKTGDLARYRRDGSIEFLGRADDQIKVRGFRIELGEIEASLRLHPRVREAAVLARADDSGNPGDKRLVAYVVAEASAAVSHDELRGFLRDRLPEYMLPAVTVALEGLPRTPNGKLDRKALPAPDSKRAESEQSFVAPRTPLEQKLAQTFASLLKIDRVGIHDNFFDLGGHSLLVVRLLAEIEKACGERLSVASLFQAPTVQQIAHIIEGRRASRAPRGADHAAGGHGAVSTRQPDAVSDRWQTLVPLNPHGATPPLFSLWMGIATELRNLSRHLGKEQRFYGVISHWDPKTLPLTRMEDMAAYCLADIRALQPHGPYYISSDCVTSLIALEIAQRLVEQGERIAMLLLIDPPALNNVAQPRSAQPAQPLQQIDPSGGQPAGQRKARSYLNRMRLDRHLRSIRALGAAETVAYVSTRMFDRTRDLVENVGSKICFSCGLNPPYWLLPRYMLDLHLRAKRHYVPRAYAGKITFIWATDGVDAENLRRKQRAWSKLAAQSEHHTLPHQHHELFIEPYIKSLAARMKHCLADAKAAQAKREAADKQSNQSSLHDRAGSDLAPSARKGTWKR